MKQHIVVPFVPTTGTRSGYGADVVAEQVEDLIEEYTSDGWSFLSIENISSFQQGDKGCFGVGATPGAMSSLQVIIFEK